MKPAGLDHAKRALAKCERALIRMKSPDDDVADAWEDFLAAAAKIYEKLRGAAVGHTESWKWYAARLDQRRDDPLLSYIHHARNIEHHGICEVISMAGAYVSIGPAPGSREFSFTNLEIRDGVVYVDELGPGTIAEAHPPYIKLEGVFDRVQGKPAHVKEFYPVPEIHLGVPLRGDSALETGELAMVYLREMVADADSRRR